MSPSEDELRAALRGGEGGDSVDADAVMARARALRRTRRVRLGSITAAVVVVGGLAAGLATLRGGGSNGRPAAQPGGTTTPSVTATVGATTPPPAPRSNGPTGTRTVDPSACPARPGNVMLPGGGGTGQFGGDAPVFTQPVSQLLVCQYRPGAASAPATALALTGPQAQQVAGSLNDAPSTRPQVPMCAGAVGPTLLLRAPGQTDVVVTFGCGGYESDRATNGTAVRYAWQPPPVLQPLTPSS